MGYIPQFINGDATTLGKALVTATTTQAAARDLIGLGEGDRPTFGPLRINTDTANGIDIWTYSNSGFRQPTIRLLRQRGTLENPLPVNTAGFPAGRITFGSNSAAIEARSAEGWEGDGRGTHLRFTTTPIGSPATEETERLRICDSGKVIIGSPYGDDGEPDLLQVNGSTRVVSLYGDGGTLAIRNGTNAQSLNLYKTYTSETNFERLQFDTTDDAYRIGSAVGSSGGSNRVIQIGHFGTAGGFTSLGSLTLSPSAAGGSVALRGTSIVLTSGIGGTGNVHNWELTSEGHLIPPTATTGDLGGASRRIRNAYIGGEFLAYGTVRMLGLPTSDPGGTGRVWSNGGLLALGNLDTEVARTSLGLGTGDRPTFAGVTIGSNNDVNLTVTGRMQMHVVNSGGISINGYYGNNAWRQPIFHFYRHRGTRDEPLDPKPGDSLGSISWASRATINATAMGVDGEPLGNYISISTTPSGTDSVTERMRINHDGAVIVGAPYTTDDTNLLQVNGSIRTTGISGPSGILDVKNDTNAQRLNLYKTYTSATNFERLQFDTTTDAYRIGSTVGNAGGVGRELELGYHNASSVWVPHLIIPSRDNVAGVGVVAITSLSGAAGSGNQGFVRPDALGVLIGSGSAVLFRLTTSGLRPHSDLGVSLGAEDRRWNNLYVGGDIFLSGLPTTDPASAGQVWNNGGLLALGNLDIEAAQDALDVGFLNVTETETTDDYIYYGGTRSGGSWKINRYDKDTLEMTSATEDNNLYSDLETAWIDRETLTYD